MRGNLEIDVRVRSISKAIRNDPRPTPPLDDYIQLLNKDSPLNTSDEMSDGSSCDMSDTSHVSDDDIFSEFKWIEQIDGLIFHRDDKSADLIQIGYCDGKLIRREDIRKQFWFAMEQPTEETCSLGFGLFDRYGRLKPKFRTRPGFKGSGVWNTELDHGDILLIESIRMDEQYRRQGQGGRLVKAMLERVKTKSLRFFPIVRPDAVCGDIFYEPSREGSPKDQWSELAHISKSFWRSLGFRRIGSSSWFGFALDPEHPSRHLSPQSDYEIPPLSSIMLDVQLERRMRVVLERGGDDDFVRFLSEVFRDTAGDNLPWTLTDADGNTLLHHAATNFNPNSIQWIIKRTKVLLHQRNADGETPLDALMECLENSRTTSHSTAPTEDISDDFSGYSDTAVGCLVLLRHVTELTEIVWQRLKYGCTCGECISGFLSPRMRFALECEAELMSDLLGQSIEDGSFWVENNNAFLAFLPRHVKNDLRADHSMRHGFMRLCDHIATCLRRPVIPNETNVQLVMCEANEWPPTSSNFLQYGGSVGAVATMLFQRAMEHDELAGDPLHMEAFIDQIQQIPKCRNDHEFGFVSGMCGYEKVSSIWTNRLV